MCFAVIALLFFKKVITMYELINVFTILFNIINYLIIIYLFRGSLLLQDHISSNFSHSRTLFTIHPFILEHVKL